MVLGIIGALLLLTFLVVIHEWGHFTMGRALGFTIEEFSIGFGPKIVKWFKKSVQYTIRCLPLGGYVRFYGEYDSDEEEDKLPAPAAENKVAFNKMPVGRRSLVFAAGPLVNLVFAILLTVIILCAFGDYQPFVFSVTPGSPAEEAGLMAGDRVVSVDGRNIDFFVELQVDPAILDPGPDNRLSLSVEREGEIYNMDVGFRYDELTGKNLMGITYAAQRVYFGFFEAIGLSFKWFYINILAIINAIGGAFAGKGLAEMAGPVGTTVVISQAFLAGLESILRMAAIISINLGIINLFPIPALDGGKLVMMAVEKVRRRPASEKAEIFLNLVGFGLLIVLVVFLTVQDISRLTGVT